MILRMWRRLDSGCETGLRGGRGTGGVGFHGGLMLAALWLSLGPHGVQGQDGSPFPTLSDLGLGYRSEGGLVELSLSGRLDLEAYAPGSEPPWLIPDTDPFATGRLRLFTDLFVGEAWYLTAELRADGGEAPRAGHFEARVEQLFLRWTPEAVPMALQVGRFASPFGSYPTRHHSVADPFIRPPLHYDFRTMVSGAELPGNSTQFMQWKDPELVPHFRPIGAPPIWGSPYQWGAMVMGAVGRLNYRAAVLNSAPSSEPEAWGWKANPMDAPSLVAAVGWRFLPSLRAEAWVNRGPYLEKDPLGTLPGEAEISDYTQLLRGGEVTYQRGYTTLRAELVHDVWEVPNVSEDVVDISYSLEAHRKLGPSWFVAGRFGAMEFNEFPFQGIQYDGTFVEGRDRWDDPVRRLQLAGGWRIYQNVEVRAEYAWNWATGPVDPMGDLFSMQLWWAF